MANWYVETELTKEQSDKLAAELNASKISMEQEYNSDCCWEDIIADGYLVAHYRGYHWMNSFVGQELARNHNPSFQPKYENNGGKALVWRLNAHWKSSIILKDIAKRYKKDCLMTRKEKMERDEEDVDYTVIVIGGMCNIDSLADGENPQSVSLTLISARCAGADAIVLRMHGTQRAMECLRRRALAAMLQLHDHRGRGMQLRRPRAQAQE
jgi:hypothetical protein